MKITDENIESTKFWCIFNNKEYNDFFNYLSTQFNANKKTASKRKSPSNKEATLSESFKDKMSNMMKGVRNYVGAKTKKIFNAGIKNNSIAYMQFVCAKKDYTVTYNVKKQSWYLYYTNFGMFNTDSLPTEEETSSLQKTQIFKDFVERCKESIVRVIDNDVAFNILQKAMLVAGKKNEALYLQEVKDNKDSIKNNMFKVKEIKT